MKRAPFSLYVHIPYCIQKCPYCDFNTYAVARVPQQEYMRSAFAELDYYAVQPEWKLRPLHTVYFGGGTPSLIEPKYYLQFFKLLKERFELSSNAEITLEANPGMLDREILDGFLEAGFNRLSLGSQSFQPETLEKLGRVHTPDQIHFSLEQARIAGFDNISLDLIFGVPEQTQENLRDDITSAIALGPEHISAYSLTYEKGTPFYKAKAQGVLRALPDDVVGDMMEELIERLTASGFVQYEISNFAQKGKESKHNTAYWKRSDYLGLGAGAHSYFRSSVDSALRWSNYALPVEYMNQATALGSALSWSDVLKPEDLLFEFFFLGLRNLEGVSLRDFKKEFSLDPLERYGPTIENLKEAGLLKVKADKIALSPEGVLVADSVIEQFAA